MPLVQGQRDATLWFLFPLCLDWHRGALYPLFLAELAASYLEGVQKA